MFQTGTLAKRREQNNALLNASIYVSDRNSCKKRRAK